MRKISFLLGLVLLLGLSVGVSALELNGGINYNTYAGTIFNTISGTVQSKNSEWPSLIINGAYRYAKPAIYLYNESEPIVVPSGWIPYDYDEAYDMSGFSFNFGLSYDL